MSATVSSSPHIFTLTGNLLAERTLEFESWTPGKTQRARRETFQVGGKGINVSKMLHRLGVANTALGFIGGATGEACANWLRERKFTTALFPSTTETRAGVVVRDARGRYGETTFLGPDTPPDPAALRACADFLDAQPDGDFLALCGSFPGWREQHFDPLRGALERWLGRGRLVADTYGPPLAWAAQRPVSLVKINADEFRTLGSDTASVFPSAPRCWIITDGPRDIRVRDEAGQTHTLSPPTIREVSPTGSGDVLLACILQGITGKNLPLREAVQFAIPYAAANSAHGGIAEFSFGGLTRS
jgi:1-phosphofructokinase